jgi:hypothetical protein
VDSLLPVPPSVDMSASPDAGGGCARAAGAHAAEAHTASSQEACMVWGCEERGAVARWHNALLRLEERGVVSVHTTPPCHDATLRW